MHGPLCAAYTLVTILLLTKQLSIKIPFVVPEHSLPSIGDMLRTSQRPCRTQVWGHGLHFLAAARF